MNRWKLVAIIFIILFSVETLFLYWAYSRGVRSIKHEEGCIIDVCENYDSYSYNKYTDICSCYLDGEDEPKLIIPMS